MVSVLTTMTLRSQVYIESILALQRNAGPSAALPLAIMTSDDTHARTLELLEQNAHYGMQPDQITLLKQEKVWRRGSCIGPMRHQNAYPQT